LIDVHETERSRSFFDGRGTQTQFIERHIRLVYEKKVNGEPPEDYVNWDPKHWKKITVVLEMAEGAVRTKDFCAREVEGEVSE
jgi:hypothetical protein